MRTSREIAAAAASGAYHNAINLIAAVFHIQPDHAGPPKAAFARMVQRIRDELKRIELEVGRGNDQFKVAATELQHAYDEFENASEDLAWWIEEVQSLETRLEETTEQLSASRQQMLDAQRDNELAEHAFEISEAKIASLLNDVQSLQARLRVYEERRPTKPARRLPFFFGFFGGRGGDASRALH